MRSLLKISLNRLRGRDILDASVDLAEQVFHAPPFTASVTEAVRRISTRLPFKADEASRLLCERESNAASASEYQALLPLMQQLGKPRRVLEIGPGFGRSVVYFSKRKLWAEDAAIHLYDADGTETKYKQKYYDRPPKWPDVSSFCGNLSLLRAFLEYNAVHNYTIFDAAQLPLHELPGPYDFVYGFYSIGFHWSVEHYLDEIEPLFHEKTLFVCTMNKHFRPFAGLNKYSVRILETGEVKKKSAPTRLLLLSKSELPAAGLTLKQAFPDF